MNNESSGGLRFVYTALIARHNLNAVLLVDPRRSVDWEFREKQRCTIHDLTLLLMIGYVLRGACSHSKMPVKPERSQPDPHFRIHVKSFYSS